VTYPNFNT